MAEVNKERIFPPVKFLCLAGTEDECVPLAIAHEEVLVEAGLGEKRSKFQT